MRFFALISRLAAIPVILTLVFFNFFKVPKGFTGVLQKSYPKQEKVIQVLQPGYHWRWDGFIPTLWQFDLVDAKTFQTEVALTENLKYSEYFENAFRVLIKVRVDYKINTEHVAQYLTRFQNDTSQAENYVKQKTQVLLNRKFTQLYQDEKDVATLQENLHAYLNNPLLLEQEWQEFAQEFANVPYFTLVKIETLSLQVPDAKLYYKQSKNVSQYLDILAKNAMKALEAKAELKQENEKQAEVLDAELIRIKKIGELIRENPHLLEYLKLEKLNPKASVIFLEDSFDGKISVPVTKEKTDSAEK